MNKSLKITSIIVGITAFLPGLFFAFSKEKKHFSNIKFQQPVEITNRFNNYVNAAPSCPSGAAVPDVISEDTEYNHCKDCQMGVFFKKTEEELECSFCLKTRKV